MTMLDDWMAERMGVAGPLSSEAVRAWQMERLIDAVAYARASSPFYRARRDWPDVEIRSLDDLARLPFTTSADLLRNDPPLLALSQSAIARVVSLPTSGTSGPPKRLFFSPEDREATIDFFAHGMGLFTRPGDRVAIAFPGGGAGGLVDGLAVALGRLGALALPAPAPLDPPKLAAWLRAEQPDVIAGPPVPLLAAARVAAFDGGAPLTARAVLLSADHAAQSLVRGIGSAFGAEVFQHWGMTETGYGGAVDCACHCGCHVRENELLVEIVEPATSRPAPAGAIGEVVVTALRRRAVPLVRYRTGDLARLIEARCACGSVLRRLGDFSGRVDEVVRLPGGAALSLPRLDEAIFAIDAAADYSAEFVVGAPATLRLSIATPPPMRVPATLDAVQAALAKDTVVGPATHEGLLRIELSLGETTLFPRTGKRRLMQSEERACARRC